MHVSWFEADAFARWRGARLPSEAEWERAASLAGAERGHLDQLRFGPGPAGPFVGDCWEWTASEFRGYPGFAAFPYREYSEVFFDRGYRVLRGASWATRPTVARQTFRNWDLPQRRQIFAGFRCAERRGVSATATVQIECCDVRDTLADDVRDRPRAPAEGAAAQVLLRRARLRAVRPDHLAARVLPHARRALDPQPPRARHRGRLRRGGARGARLGHGVEDPRAPVRDGRRAARCAATCPSTWTSRWSRPAPSSWWSSTPASRVHGVVGDFGRDLGLVPAGPAPAVRVPRRDDRQPLPARARGASCAGCARSWDPRTGSWSAPTS